jgi:hypothetical protein
MKILGKLAIALLLIGVVACVVALVCTRRELRSSGQYRVTGINVGARYGTVLSTNSPGASQWCPTDWQPVEYAGRARVCREQFAFLCESLSDLSRSEELIAEFATTVTTGRVDESLSYRLNFSNNSRNSTRGPTAVDTNQPYCGIVLWLAVRDPRPPDAPLNQTGPISLHDFKKYKMGGMVNIGQSFFVSAFLPCSNPELRKAIHDRVEIAVESLLEWERSRRVGTQQPLPLIQQ